MEVLPPRRRRVHEIQIVLPRAKSNRDALYRDGPFLENLRCCDRDRRNGRPIPLIKTTRALIRDYSQRESEFDADVIEEEE